LTKTGGSGKDLGRALIGWEKAPPKMGECYSISFGKGKGGSTSPVELVTETPNGIIIITKNSMYEIKILEEP
jgi:hypothetical protein